ncbi:MAG TPA: YihY/virulence factor BrkB family protein [Thermomicrobiales bacterium]|nr:YihY/virulence factor BrkB family protein [Thermomicrobiales bacterium]
MARDKPRANRLNATISFAVRVTRNYFDHNMTIYAAALSFHALLAIFPFLIFLLALLSFLRIPDFFDWVLDQAALALPEPAFAVVKEVVESVQGQGQGDLLSIGAIVAFGGAAVGVRSLMKAMNIVYAIPETRAFWKKYLLSFMYTFGLALLIIVAGGSLLLGPETLEWLSGFLGMSHDVVALWGWLRFPVAVVGLMLISALVYFALPNVDQPFRLTLPGAIIAVLSWLGMTYGFSIYATNFGNYASTYGSLAGIVILLFYFFLSASVLLAGAEINAEVHRMARGPAAPKDLNGKWIGAYAERIADRFLT